MRIDHPKDKRVIRYKESLENIRFGKCDYEDYRFLSQFK